MRIFLAAATFASVILFSGLFAGVAYGAISLDKGTYTWTDKVRIKVATHGWSSDESFVKISTESHELKSYHLSKAGNRLYTGEIVLTGFLHDVDGDGKPDTNPRTSGSGSNDGFLESARDGKLNISLRFGDGTKMSTSAKISWNEGKISFDRDIYTTEDSASIQVIDPDMNLNPRTLDKVKVNVSSDSDRAGILVNAIETAEESGTFEGAVSFVQDSASSGNRLFAIPGDAIYVTYEDRTLPSPHSISDDLRIEDSAEVYSSVISTERLENSAVFFSDGNGNKLQSFLSDTPMQIVGTITNGQSFAQEFVYLVQIRNGDNSTESISWIRGEIASAHSMDVSQSWTPKRPGEYKVETFVWESISDPAVLSAPMAVMIIVE